MKQSKKMAKIRRVKKMWRKKTEKSKREEAE